MLFLCFFFYDILYKVKKLYGGTVMEHYIYIIIFELVVGGFTAIKAKEKNRNPFIWFFLGFIFSVIALLLIFVLPYNEDRED